MGGLHKKVHGLRAKKLEASRDVLLLVLEATGGPAGGGLQVGGVECGKHNCVKVKARVHAGKGAVGSEWGYGG